MIYAFPHLERFLAFVKERHAIWKRRHVLKEQQPWTKDKIMSVYKFTNVYRELDRVTMWLAEHWREPHANEKDLWFSFVVARFVNWPETMAQLALPGRWNEKQFIDVMHTRKKAGLQVYGGAYIIGTNGTSVDKAQYLARAIFTPIWEMRAAIRPRQDENLQGFYNRLLSCRGMGTFMTAQVVADIKYAPVLKNAQDWWTFAASGPGSRRGLAYVMGLDVNTRWREHEWKAGLMELQTLVDPWVSLWRYPRVHAQDLQNCLCEYSKYRRTELGDGRPKMKFAPFGS